MRGCGSTVPGCRHCLSGAVCGISVRHVCVCAELASKVILDFVDRSIHLALQREDEHSDREEKDCIEDFGNGEGEDQKERVAGRRHDHKDCGDDAHSPRKARYACFGVVGARDRLYRRNGDDEAGEPNRAERHDRNGYEDHGVDYERKERGIHTAKLG